MTITSYDIFRSGSDVQVTANSSLAAPDVTVYYNWYQDGAYVGATVVASRSFYAAPGAQFDVTVVDTLDPAFDPVGGAPAGYPAKRSIYWIASPTEDVAAYKVEGQQALVGSWELIARVPVVAGRWQYTVDTGRLPDRQRWEFRVTALDDAGNPQATVPVYDTFVVRTPDAPAFAVTVETDQTFTFSEVS